MYEAFYGLRERPFDLTPNPRFLLMTPAHREALTTIQYGIAGRKGITLLVGPAGTGKTTLLQVALARQDGKSHKVLFLKNPTLTRNEFYQFLAHGFGLSENAEKSKTEFLRQLDKTLNQRHAQGIVTALVVDEAQAMPDALLEEVRLLSNIETTTEKLLPVVLVGQTELADRLKHPSLQQLKQRIALRTSLAPLNADETAAYIAERIRIAGGDVRNVFSLDATAFIHKACGGIPRMISIVCDNALVSGFAYDQRPVGRAVVTEVCRDLDVAVPTLDRAPEAFNAGPAMYAAPPAPPPPPAPAPAPAAPAPTGSLILARPVSPARATLGLLNAEPQPEASAPPRRGFRSLFQRTASR